MTSVKKKPTKITATFDALEIGTNPNAKMLTTGAYYNARKHPQYWSYRLELTTPTNDGGFDIQKAFVRTSHKMSVSDLCEDIRGELRTMGDNSFISCMVYAEVVPQQDALRLYRLLEKKRKNIEENTLEYLRQHLRTNEECHV